MSESESSPNTLDPPPVENPSTAKPSGSNKDLLRSAWVRQQTYSDNASRYQARFVLLRTTLAILSVAVVMLTVLENPEFQCPTETPLADGNWECTWRWLVDDALLVLPITITALLAFSVRFDRGQNWILLRGNAETLKMAIYYYRTRVAPYNDDKRDDTLAKRIKQISEGMKGSPVHQGALCPYENQPEVVEKSRTGAKMGIFLQFLRGSYETLLALFSGIWNFLFQVKPEKRSINPKKLEDLTDPEAYITERLESQFNWYRKKSQVLARQMQIFQAGVYLFGGIGTFLAATETLKSWVAVTTALTAAFVNYLEFKRIEATLVGYNQTADALYDIRAWWLSLTPQKRKEPESYHNLVTSCEETIRSEHTSWLQDMQERLAKLYETTGADDQPKNNGQQNDGQQNDGQNQQSANGQSSAGDASDQPMEEKQQDGQAAAG